MTDSTQIQKIEAPSTYMDYDIFSYLDTDMLFLRHDKFVMPEKYEHLTNDFDGKENGVYDNDFISAGNRNAAFDGFAKKFNNYINQTTNWKVTRAGVDGGKRHDGTDTFFNILHWNGNVDGRLARDQDNDSSEKAYADISKAGENDHEITYQYKIDTDAAVQKMKYFTHDTADGQYGLGLNSRNKLAINHQNAMKWIAWQARRYLEQLKQDLQNRYWSRDWRKGNYMYTEFDDVNRVQDSYGIMFFIEVSKYVDDIDKVMERLRGQWDVGSYDMGEYDNPDNADDFTVDPLDPENTTIWYSQFDIKAITAHTYNGEDFLEITIVIPEGIALNNRAKVLQVNTLGQTNGAHVSMDNSVFDETIYKTYQIDGLVQRGLPDGFIARFKLDGPQPYYKMAVGRQLSIIGNDTWADDGLVIGTSKTAVKVNTTGKYQPTLPFYNGTKEEPLLDDNLLLPADWISRKYDTSKVGSLNRIKYRFNRGIGLQFDRYATSMELTKKYPLATLLAIKTDYWYTQSGGETDNYFSPFKSNFTHFIGNNHYYSVTMRPVKPIYTHPITGYYHEEESHAVMLKKLQEPQQFVLNYTTTNPDYTIFTNDGKYVDIRYTSTGQRSILFKSEYGYFDYTSNTSNSDFTAGTWYVTKDMPRVWLATANFNMEMKKSLPDNGTVYQSSGNPNVTVVPGQHDLDYLDWAYGVRWKGFEVQPAQILEYNVNGGTWRRVRPYNSPNTQNNYVDLKVGDKLNVRWATTAGFNNLLPTSIRLTTKNPVDNLFYEDNISGNGIVNGILDFPLFGQYPDNFPDGTGDVNGDALFLGTAIPVIDGHKRLYAGQNADGSMNKIEVDTNRMDLSTIPVNMGIVARELRYI
jgi:hypothetical protein